MQSLIFAFREKEDYDSAFEILDFSLKKFDKNKDLLYTKAILHYEVGDIKKALETADLVLEISPQDPHSLNLKGYMMIEYIIEEKRKTGFYDTNKLDEARKLIEEALKRRPKDPYIIDSLGWYFFAKGDIEKAEEMIRKAYEMKPDDAVIAEHLADILVLKNEEEKALELYKTGLQKGKPKGYDRIRIERKIKELEHKIRAKIKK
jgi:tetratricopeptide (TPR) repeat protein